MPEIELDRLRTLRRRSEALLASLVSDLKAFQHGSKKNGFVRRPDSPSDPDDVNVTTTCSCLMALAIADKLGEFYPASSKVSTSDVFKKLIEAPWMSSGLTENNAFTTTLVLRTLGCLIESGAPVNAHTKKAWELTLPIKDFPALARKLQAGADPISKSIFEWLPRSTQTELNAFVSSPQRKEDKLPTLQVELGRMVRTGRLYESERFKKVKLSDASKRTLKQPQDGYTIAHLNRLLLHDCYPTEIAGLRELSLQEIAEAISEKMSHFQINEYPPAAAVIYWFVDGVDRAQIALPEKHWDRLCDWGREEFGRQRSLAVSKHAAMMDPVAMAMAASLCARLRSISNRAERGANNGHQAKLPSVVELETSILELFAEQRGGIWPKYFPLFHYQEAGSNFCFTFELLEAVLVEFGYRSNGLISNPDFVTGLENAVIWCENNRLQSSEIREAKPLSFNGWNSGGFLPTLRKGQPESWATAVVHMFLWEIVEALSRHIQRCLLEKYEASEPSDKWKNVGQLLDIQLWMGGDHRSLVKGLENTIVRSFRGASAAELRKRPRKKAALSALLFGPPGTSKTEVTKAIAKDLGWPLVEIDPSHFLQSSYQEIYVQAERIFDDVMDFSGVVILFDEMDALVQKRDGENIIDTESKFLTTYMLPKLSKLHDRGRAVFFMATNFQASFDDAIKRAGRFDFLFCMGPPTLASKCSNIHTFFGENEKATAQTKNAGDTILGYCAKEDWLKEQLGLYTFGEFKSFITGLAQKSKVGDEIVALKASGFLERVKEDSASVTLKFDDLTDLMTKCGCSSIEALDEIDIDLEMLKELKKDQRPAIKYVLDRRQSRRQCARIKDEAPW